MQTFRAYLLDEEGRIRWGEFIEALDAREALLKAKELCREDTPLIEVWLGANKVRQGHC